MAVLALAGGLISAPVVAPATSSASPCDGADCVPYVARDASAGGRCLHTGTRWVFGLDAGGNTMICSLTSKWVQTPPLIGIRTVRAPCSGEPGMAQSPDGLPLSCKHGGWSPDYDAIFYES